MGTQKESLKMAIKDEILSQFRKGYAKPDDVLSVAWLYDDFLPSLSTKEQQALEVFLIELIIEGLLIFVAGPKATYALTQKGKEIMC